MIPSWLWWIHPYANPESLQHRWMRLQKQGFKDNMYSNLLMQLSILWARGKIDRTTVKEAVSLGRYGNKGVEAARRLLPL